jgi:hypothetical protein
MPIKRELRFFYPIDWRELSSVIRFGRAAGRCEQCGRPHNEDALHLGDGRWWDAAFPTWRNRQGQLPRRLPPPEQWNGTLLTTHVVLACAHLDHDPTNNRSATWLPFASAVMSSMTAASTSGAAASH